MARPRRPVASLQESLAPRLAPQAAPVQRASVATPPPDLPIYDFAGISETISGYLRKQQEERDKAAEQQGEQFAEAHRPFMADLQEDLAGVKDPAERDKIQREAFALLRKMGEIPDMADPNVRIGLERANGRIMVGQYWQGLQRRVTDVSTAVDPQTGLPVQPMDAERVMAEEWDKISGAPAVQGFYGGREALATKIAADERFLQEVTQRRSAAEKAHYESTLAQDWGQEFDAILDNHDAVGSEELGLLSAKVAAEVRDHNMLNPREVLLSALELSFRRRAAVDPDDALRAVHAAQDIVIGGVRMGDDRSGVGERLQELTRQVRQDARESDELALRSENTDRQLAVQKAQSLYVPMLLKAKREGQSLRGLARQLEPELLARDPQRGAFSVRAMQEFIQDLEQDRPDDPSVTGSISDLIADGRTDDARALAESSRKAGSIRGETYAGYLDQIEKRADVGTFMEDDNLYNQVKARYNTAAPSGFAEEVQSRYDAETLDFQRRLDRDYAEKIRATQGDPNQRQILRDWLADREEADNAQRTQQAADYRQRRDQAVAEIQKRQTRLLDASDVIDQAEAAGSLTLQESTAWRAQNTKAGAGKDELLNIALRDASQLLDARMQVVFGGPPSSQEDVTLAEEAQRRLRDRLGLDLDTMLADQANDPRTFTARARAVGNQVVDDIGDKLFPNQNKAARSAVARGESVEGARDRILATEAARTAAEGLALRTAPAARETFQATDPIFAPAAAGGMSLHQEGVPQRFYEYAAGWWSQRDPIFGTPVDREAMERQALDLYYTLGERPDRDAVMAGALDVIGVDALQVVRGEAVLEPSQAVQAQVGEELARVQAGIHAQLLPDFLTRPRIESLQRLLQPVPVKLEGHQWKPYITPFFRSREALSAFSDDPAYPEFLTKIGVDPANPDEVAVWLKYQVLAIERSQ